MRLTCMRGYSGSGKSTRAADIAKETGAVIVNRDYLRKMLLGEWWTGNLKDEEAVTIAEHNLVGDFLTAGNDVIVDATHLNPRYLREWAKLATKLGADFEVVDVTTPVHACIDLDALRGMRGERAVGKDVILQQAKRFPMKNWPTITAKPPLEIVPVAEVADVNDAIIVDIDGTLAHNTGGRSPYDYTRVGEDTPDDFIIRLVNIFYDNNLAEVFVVSGRDDTCFSDTYAWLKGNHVRFDTLLMRPADAKDDRGNKLPDYIVKYNLFNEHIRGKYNVRYVLDDRQQVVDMWRKLGLKCLQVAPGDF